MENDLKTNLKWALFYRSIGWSVFPTSKKLPLVPWIKYQSEIADEEIIIKWWEQFPDADIGIATGKVSGIIAVDVEKGGDISGLTSTIISKTGGGGFHYLYLHPELRIPNSVKKIRDLIDIRGDGGFIVVPPSSHQSGNNYEWLSSPINTSIAEMPKWILDKIVENKREPTDWNKFLDTSINEGARNMSATQLAGKILHDLSPELWETIGWPALSHWNQNKSNPPLLQEELRKTWESIKRLHSQNGYKENKSKEIKKGQAVTRRLSDITSVPISWLWEGRIALGKLTMIVGDPGLGKSLVTTNLATKVSKGYLWPVDQSKAPIGNIIIISAEDDPADTIKPRLEAAEADCDRIHIMEAIREENTEGVHTERMFSLERDIEALEEKLSEIKDCRLIIIDPISAYLGKADSNKNSDIRGLLAPLSKLAEKHKVAIVVVSHLNKNTKESSIYRTTGSLAFIAAVRTAYIVTKDKENPERRLFLPIKNNIAKDNNGFAYTIGEGNNFSPVIEWEQNFVEQTADEAMIPPATREERTETEDAIDFLRYILGNGSMKANEVKAQAKQVGIKDKALRCARQKLGIKPYKTSFKDGFWVWRLPEGALVGEEAMPKGEGAFDPKGHLRNTNNLELLAEYLDDGSRKDKDNITISELKDKDDIDIPLGSIKPPTQEGMPF
jgi:putative DNA primase/helicase